MSADIFSSENQKQVKKEEVCLTRGYKAAKHIQLREQWQLLIIVAPRLAAKTSVRKARFSKPSVKARGVIEKFIGISVENAMFHVKRK